jgi:hypothetical protein
MMPRTLKQVGQHTIKTDRQQREKVKGPAGRKTDSWVVDIHVCLHKHWHSNMTQMTKN